MKSQLLAALLVLTVAGAAHAQPGMDMKKDVKGTAHTATGVVTRVDRDKVTIRHEPVQSLNWPAMTMAFGVKDKGILDKVAKGKKVEFEFVQQGKQYVITSVR